MDVNSLIKAFSALDSGSSDTTDALVTASTRDDASLNGHPPTSSSDTAATTPSRTNNSLPPQASLLGLPQELKDQIYGYLTEDENRIILGWRFVAAYKRHHPMLSYEECLNSAIALHPLSMTCKEMLNDFQPVFLRATKSRWTFSVNNFDLKQLHYFTEHVNAGLSLYPSVGWYVEWYVATAAGKPQPPSDHVQCTLRFQMDNNAVASVDKMCDFILSSDPDDRDAMDAFDWVHWADVEVATLYSSRTGASAKHVRSMTNGQAKRIEFTLRDLEHMFLAPAAFSSDRNDWIACDRELAGGFLILEYYWFKKLWEAIKDMHVGEEVTRDRV